MSEKKAPNGWHYHPNGGGLVHDSAHVNERAFVERDARVYRNAVIAENVFVFGDAEVHRGVVLNNTVVLLHGGEV